LRAGQFPLVNALFLHALIGAMKVILFDGVCNLCNGLVNWIIDHDKKAVFKFSSLQSAYGLRMIEKFGIKGEYLSTVVLVDDDKAWLRSDAVLLILKHLGGIWAAAYGFIIVPAFIRNFIYNIVARNRYRWFGKRDTCRVPTPELKNRFLE
jgi:predicted DCC family thiol-disulfide oxidoreductase YuxK